MGLITGFRAIIVEDKAEGTSEQDRVPLGLGLSFVVFSLGL